MLLNQGFSANGRIEHRSNVPSRIWIDPNVISDDCSLGELLLKTGYKQKILKGDLRLKRQTQLASGRIIRYGQYSFGFPVIGGGITIHCNDYDIPVSLFSTFTSLHLEKQPVFSVSAEQAYAIATETVDFNSLRADPSADRVILPNNCELVPCWRIRIPARHPTCDWEVFVDGVSGEVQLVEDRLLRFDGTGSVFLPDPKTTLHDTTLRDEDDSPEAVPNDAYIDVEIRDIERDENDHFILAGPYVDTSPSETHAIEEELSFSYDRGDDRFEEVMAYYHIDHQARYIISLGFEEIPPNPQLVDVNRLDEDISFYSPFTGILTTGTGGVDDAEDADVLIHEYSHAIVYLLTEGWRGGETSILSEGLCDYFAGDYSLAIDSDFQPYKLYNWDGHNEFWDGRILDSDLTYNEIENLDPHIAGQMWSSMLIELRQSVDNRDLWNSIVIDHIGALGDSTTIHDATESLLHSDLVLNDAGFRRLIVRACESRNILVPGEFSPRIVHPGLSDSEEINSPHLVRVEMISQIPLDPDKLWLIYGFANEEPDTINLDREDEEENYYFAEIPAPGFDTDVYYYFAATDTTGVFATLPAGAPLTSFRFRIGTDRQPPAILFTDSLGNTVFREHSANFKTRVMDNLGIREVSLVLLNSQQQPLDQFELAPLRNEPGSYLSRVHWNFEDNPSLLFQVIAIDNSRSRNRSHSVATSFSLNEDAVFDEFERESSRWLLSGWTRKNNAALSGRWGLADRESQDVDAPREAIASIDENWDLSSFRRFRIFFWETHQLNRDEGETGLFEISSDDGESWTELLQISGNQFWWVRRELNLDEYTGQNNSPVRIRWRSYLPEGALPGEGWNIDNIFLSTDNIVGVDNNISVLPNSQIISEPFPNPTNGIFDINYQISLPGQIRIIDINGRSIMEIPIPDRSGGVSIDMMNYASGSYFITFETERIITRKHLILLK